jgi:thiol-disulfide isomerase/thioredoxin
MIRFALMFCAMTTWTTSALAADFAPSTPRQIEFVVRDRNGDAHTAPEFRARLTVLHFWASWCLPCRDELPALAALQSDFGRDGVRVVAVSVDRLGWDVIDRTTAKLGVRGLELYHDRDREATVALGIEALPTTIIVDADGREVARMRGQGEWGASKIRRDLLGFAPP